MSLRLEAGKSYVTDRGAIVGPVERTIYENGKENTSWPFTIGFHDFWDANGKAFARNGSPGNLVAELDTPKLHPVTKASLLDSAKDAVADRGLNYGSPEDNFRRIADLWNAHLANRVDEKGETADTPRLTAADVAMMMVLMKVARLQNSPAHLDSWIDLAGYSACGAEITNGSQNAA